jgi:hypothetical protein
MSMIIDGTAGLTFNNATTQASAGSVLQVVNVTFSTEVSTSSSTFSDTGLSASITPKFTTSKILTIVDIQGAKSGNNTGLDLLLLRGSTSIIQFGKNVGYTGTTAYSIIGSASCSYLDSPATTSSTTYKVQMASNGNVATARINDNAPTSTLTLLEIAG